MIVLWIAALSLRRLVTSTPTSLEGNDAGPAIWVAISIVLLSIMRQKGHRLSILSALSLSTLVMAGFAFVDATDIIHSANDPNTSPFEVLHQSQAALDTWEGIESHMMSYWGRGWEQILLVLS